MIKTRDFASPRELAEYLRQLAADPDAYYEYFAWKVCGLPCVSFGSLCFYILLMLIFLHYSTPQDPEVGDLRNVRHKESLCSYLYSDHHLCDMAWEEKGGRPGPLPAYL